MTHERLPDRARGWCAPSRALRAAAEEGRDVAQLAGAADLDLLADGGDDALDERLADGTIGPRGLLAPADDVGVAIVERAHVLLDGAGDLRPGLRAQADRDVALHPGTPSSMRRGGCSGGAGTLVLCPRRPSLGRARSGCDQSAKGMDAARRISMVASRTLVRSGRRSGVSMTSCPVSAGERPALGDLLDVVVLLELRGSLACEALAAASGSSTRPSRLWMRLRRRRGMERPSIIGRGRRCRPGPRRWCRRRGADRRTPSGRAARVDVVALDVAEHGRARAGEEGAALIGEHELRAFLLEGGGGIGREAEHAGRASEGVGACRRGGVARGRGRAPGLGEGRRRREAERVEEAALAGRHGVVDQEGAR